MSSSSTVFFEQIYTGISTGGVGLIGVSGNSPSLRATIFGQKYDVDFKDLAAYILPTQSGQTLSNGRETVYSNLYFGGIGVVGVIQTPDLRAAYTFVEPVKSGSLDLKVYIQPIQKGQRDLGAYWRSAESGSLNLNATLTGVTPSDLMAYIRPVISSSRDLFTEIEPVPGVDLQGAIDGIFSFDLPASIIAAEPTDLPATISGQPRLDLTGSYYGYEIKDLLASLTGVTFKDLNAEIYPSESGISDLNARVAGFLGINEQALLSANIRSQSGTSTTIEATLTGVSLKDLSATVFGYTFTGLPATVTGVLFDGALEATITPTGGFTDLTAYIKPSIHSIANLQAHVDGTDYLDLLATLNNSPQSLLNATLTATGINSDYLFATVTPTYESALSGIYNSISGNLLYASIDTIPSQELRATVYPKAFYIDSSIFINTYPVSNLRAIINADPCLNSSDLSNLIVTISGATIGDLSASIIPIVGQLAIAEDKINIILKEKIIDQDWVFFIFDQRAIAEDKIRLVFANSPFGDLRAEIVGVQANSDLTATITSNYIPSISKTGVPIGQWQNLKTGETKLLRLFFRGNAINYYYSAEANTSFSDGRNEFLDIIVESYKRQNADFNSLLNLKLETKQARVSLNGFANLDSAIKYAIAASVSEIREELRAEIFGVGSPKDLLASVSGMDDTYLSDLKASLNSVANDPSLSATITPTGSLLDLYTIISPQQVGMTSTPFYDALGNRYLPTLNIISDGNYSVVLTPITASAIINVTNPDLQTTICGVGVYDMDATISGI